MKKTEEALENWNPHEDPKAESDPFRTLFVARINFDTSQSKLKREFEEFGRIRHVSITKILLYIYNCQSEVESGRSQWAKMNGPAKSVTLIPNPND